MVFGTILWRATEQNYRKGYFIYAINSAIFAVEGDIYFNRV